MYREKYLKYKNKYLQLKKMLGGTLGLNAECRAQIAINAHDDCTKCAYFHGTDALNPETGKTLSTCEEVTDINNGAVDIRYNILYFNHPDNTGLARRPKINIYNTMTRNFTEVPAGQYNMLFNVDNYHSIKSYRMNEGDLIIEQYPDDISLLCREGNIVWVSQNSKVGSGGITSCMFVIIILINNSKICLHHNMNDEPMDEHEEKKNVTNKTGIANIFRLSGITAPSVRKIFLCTNDIGDFMYYSWLVKYYNTLSENRFQLSSYGRYLVDNNNNVYGLERA